MVIFYGYVVLNLNRIKKNKPEMKMKLKMEI